MFEIYRFNQFEILAFLLVLIRIVTCFASWPVMGSENIPVQAKILASLTIAFIVFPIVGWKQLGIGIESNQMIFLAFKEVGVGLLLGLVARFFFFAVTVCGELVSLSVGISADQLFNPTMGHRTTVVEQYYVMLATMIFLSINGHHSLMTGLVQSFDVLPLSLQGVSFAHFNEIALVGREVLVAGIRMAAPVFASLFFMNVALGVVSRAAPQINVLITSLAVNVLLGLFVMMISVPLGLENMTDLLTTMTGRVQEILKFL